MEQTHCESISICAVLVVKTDSMHRQRYCVHIEIYRRKVGAGTHSGRAGTSTNLADDVFMRSTHSRRVIM